MNIKNKRFLTLGLTTALSSAVVAGVVLSVIHVKNKKDSSIAKANNGNVFLGSENGNKTFDVIQEYQDLALQSIKDIAIKDFHALYSDGDKLKVARHEENNKTHEIIKLIKSNIKGKHHVEAKKLINHHLVALKPKNGLMQIELNLALLKQGTIKRIIDVGGFKTHEEKTREDIASVKKHLESIKGLSIKTDEAIKPMDKELIFNFTNWQKLKLKGMIPFDYKDTLVFYKHLGIDKDGILPLANRIVKNGQNAQTTLNVAVTGIDAAKKAKQEKAKKEAEAARKEQEAQQKLIQLNKDVALLANQFLRMGYSSRDGVSVNSSLTNAKTIKLNSFLRYKNKETPNAPTIFGFKAPANIPEGLEVKYVPHTFIEALEGQVIISINIIHSSKTIRTINLDIKGFKGLF